MRQAICIKFPAPLSSNYAESAGERGSYIILVKEISTSARIFTNIRVGGKNRKFVGTFENLQQVLRSLYAS